MADRAETPRRALPVLNPGLSCNSEVTLNKGRNFSLLRFPHLIQTTFDDRTLISESSCKI